MIPTISLAELRAGDPGGRVAREIGDACRRDGFFAIVDHGIPGALAGELLAASRTFFALPEERKLRIAMQRGGRAWRGFFPFGGELTSGVPDAKEGLYFGRELPASDPRVVAGVPLHGPNLFPDDDVPALRPAVLAWMRATSELAALVMSAIARSLDLPADHFARTWMVEPTLLFRIFHYPPAERSDALRTMIPAASVGRPVLGSSPTAPAEHSDALRTMIPAATGDGGWGVGEHTDYGILTLLLQDDAGGLEVKSRSAGWIPVPPLPDALVCNIGDMLDLATGGLYCSTPHRVRNVSGRDRYSFPLFFDPSWDARVARLPDAPVPDDAARSRWDRANVHAFDGTWGEYLLSKVSRVFPDLFRSL